jgi:hypothetical protein
MIEESWRKHTEFPARVVCGASIRVLCNLQMQVRVTWQHECQNHDRQCTMYAFSALETTMGCAL